MFDAVENFLASSAANQSRAQFQLIMRDAKGRAAMRASGR
jgi:hypothetical protein